MTLAKRYISEMLGKYIEPTRSGKRKGERIGMNRQKYAAALSLAIYELDSGKIGKILDERSSLVSKWRTEKLFKIQVAEITTDFVNYLCKAITNSISSDQFEDAGLYNINIKKSIVEACSIEADKGNAMFLLTIWPALRNMLAEISNQAIEGH